MRSGASTKSKLAERPFTHRSPWFDGPGAASASTTTPSFTTKSSWQPTPQCGHVVRTRSVSHERYVARRFSVSAPVGHACAQLPHDSQSVARQSAPNGASISVRTPRFAVPSVWLRAASLQAPTQRWQRMHRFGS